MAVTDKITLECVDCHTTVCSEVEKAFAVMSKHTEGAHGRKPLREIERYKKPSLETFYEDALLLRPELALAA